MPCRPVAVALVAGCVFAQSDARPAGAPTPKPDPTRLTVEQWFDLETVSDPRASPDGTMIVYTRQWHDRIEDRTRSELWLMNHDGTRQRFLTIGSDPRWSPDGTRLAFFADGEPKGTQIHVLWVQTRERSQLTHTIEAPSNLQWSPDGAWLACNLQVPEKEGFKIDMPAAPKGAKWVEEPKVITRLQYRRDQRGYSPSGWRHIFVVDANGGTPRQITSGDFDHGAPQWTNDGRELVFDGLRATDADWQTRESEVYAVDVATGAVRQLTDRRGPDSSPVVVGDAVFYLGFDKTRDTWSTTFAHVVPVAGGPARCLTGTHDRAVQGLLRGRGQQVLLSYEDEGAIRCARLDAGGVLTTLTGKDLQFRASDELPGGGVLGVVTSVHEPGAIAIRHPDGRLQKLTRVNDDLLHGKQLGAVEELWWTGPDGLRIQGWLVKPPDFDAGKKYPLVLQIHGGPHAMYGVNFDFERQLHAAHGHLLLYCNPRGSTGYGQAFAGGIQNAYPGKDYDDLMAGVDAVIARGCVDTDNLFVFGGSGGGVLTAWIVGSTDRFRAAVSMFPVINWISFVGTTDGVSWYENFKQLPWEGIDEHWQRSPLRLVGNVKTPTLLLTGELDLRTPMGQTEEYYQALKLRQVDTVLVRVQDEFHGAGSKHPSNRIRRMLYVRTWFDRHKSIR
ncbi:MAG: S9 family peptidase [Planctomycetes bacterium]|nr:S9 family peptidase [Planctomycetota bacterium]